MKSEMGCDNICTAPGKTLKETCCSSLPVGALNPATLGAHSSSITVFSARMLFFIFIFFFKESKSHALPPGGWIMSTALSDWNSNAKMMKMQNAFHKRLHNNLFGANNSRKWCQISHRSCWTRASVVSKALSFYQWMTTIADSQNAFSNCETFDWNQWEGSWMALFVW